MDNDFCKTVDQYIDWQMSQIQVASFEDDFTAINKLKEKFLSEGGEFKKVKLETLFKIKANPQLDKGHFVFNHDSKYPYFTRTEKNNGILGYVDYLDEEHKIKGNSLAVGMIAMQFFYMEHDFYAGQFTKTAVPKFKGFNKSIALFFITAISKYKDIFKRVLVGDFENTFNNAEIEVPYKKAQIAFDYIKNYIKEVQLLKIKRIKAVYNQNIKNINEICNDINKK